MALDDSGPGGTDQQGRDLAGRSADSGQPDPPRQRDHGQAAPAEPPTPGASASHELAQSLPPALGDPPVPGQGDPHSTKNTGCRSLSNNHHHRHSHNNRGSSLSCL